MDWKYLFLAFWSWVVEHGLIIAAAVIAGILIPRVGRLIVRIITERTTRGREQLKSQLALVGALVYILEVVAYFFVIYTILTHLGVSTTGAAIPATVVSAAIGFGAQKVIGDYLAGFFIISEHQYGVGDFVAFDGVADQVMGTVTRLTLRSTQIRTGNGVLVTVPNSSASVTINYSQEWSRAVVDLELPMTDEDTMSSLSDTVSVVTQRAIDTAGVREDVLGEVSILPAMNITAPTAAGLPWTVGIQVTVDVSPATQWRVQRAIRAALINEFWERFQAPGDRPSTYAGPPTQAFPPVTAPGENDGTADAATATEAGEPRPLDGDTDGDDTAATSGQDGDEDATASSSRTSTGDFDAVAADVAENGVWRHTDHRSRIVRLISLGGRIRPSSGLLVIAVAVLAVVGILSANPSGGDSGILSPDRYSPATSTPVTTSTPEHSVAPETQESTPGSQTPTVAPTEEEEGTTDTDSGQQWSTGTEDSTTGTDSSSGTGTDSTTPTGESGTDDSLSGNSRSGGTTDTTTAP